MSDAITVKDAEKQQRLPLHAHRLSVIGYRISDIGYRESTQNPTFIPTSIFRAGPAAVGWAKNGEVMTPE